MSYIEKDRAEAVAPGVADGPNSPSPGGATVGDLTWIITENVARFLDLRGLSFQSIAEAGAALDSAKLELQRRVQAPYESGKLAEAHRVDPFDRLRKHGVTVKDTP